MKMVDPTVILLKFVLFPFRIFPLSSVMIPKPFYFYWSWGRATEIQLIADTKEPIIGIWKAIAAAMKLMGLRTDLMRS